MPEYTGFSIVGIFNDYYVLTKCLSPWYNLSGWMDIKHQVTYLLTYCSSTVASRTLSFWRCSAQLLKQQLAKHTSCFALPGSPPEVRSLKQQRRRAERLWLKTGLTVHKQLYNNAKKLVTKLVHKAKTTYYCNKIKESLSCKQLFSVANQLLGNKKPSPLPTVFPLIDLPKRFLDFFKDKIETIRNKLDVLSSNPPACTELSFHGRPSLISDL